MKTTLSPRSIALAFATVGCSSLFTDGQSEGGTDAERLAAQLRDDLTVEASYGVDTVAGRARLRTTIRATNTGSETILALAGQFPWWLRAYASPSREGLPMWRMEDWITATVDLGSRFEIPAGTTVEFGERWMPAVPVDAILGSSPPGVYYFTAELRVGPWSSGPVVPAGEYPAGEAYLPGPAGR
jgi:hypothetical protein